MKNTRAFQSISLLWLGSLLGAGCAFLTLVILARQLGPAEFGLFATALTMVTMVMPLAGFGIAQYWLKVFGREGWEAVRFLPSSFHFVFISTTIVILVLTLWSVYGPHNESLTVILVILSTYVIGQVVIELVGSKLQLEERYLSLTLWQLLPHIIRLGLVAVLFFVFNESGNVKNTAYVYLVVSIGIVFFGAFALFRMFKGKFDLKGHTESMPDSNQSKPSVKAIVANSWPFGLAGLFHMIYFQSDIILVQYIVGVEAAGIYNVAFMVMVAVLLFPGIVYQKFLLPKIHRWANHDREKFYKVYRQGNVVMLVLGLVAMVAVWVVIPKGIPFLFGEAYRDSIMLLNILALSVPILFVASSVGATLVTQEHMKVKVKLMGIVAVINIILNIVLIPSYGAIGAAIATVLSNSFLLGFYYIASLKVMAFRRNM